MLKKIITYLLRLIFIPLELVFAAFFILFIYILFASHISPPDVPEIHIGKRQKVGENHYVLGNNYLKKNDFGVWEMYIEGEPYERGLIYGELAGELIRRQEDIFVEQINQFVPKGAFQQLLKLLVGFFNSDIPENIPLENQQEIYGISQSFSDDYDYIAPKYTRILNYHAAHDIGHALNDYSIVGCTSLALRGKKTVGHNLLLGRNFDFYVGDAFAEDKLILFVKPTEGYAFSSYSWAGFTGVASGMNEEGLTVTINASKSDLPTGSKMPISLLAREILQYAATIEEAIAIAKKRHTFVSETLMVGSAKDGKAVLIEKSPSKLGVVRMDSDELVCANHYQSTTFQNDKANTDNIALSDSKYRFDRMNELLSATPTFTVDEVAAVLRNQLGANGDSLGMGNPRAINQLLAHHSVVMLPVERRFYISTSDYQLGAYIAYDLAQTFSHKKGIICDTIPADPFVNSTAYQRYMAYRAVKQSISAFLLFDVSLTLSDKDITSFIESNGESYMTYEMLGKYFQKKGNCSQAIRYFKQALEKKVASPAIENELKSLIKACRKQ